jgi:hypothetical protein
MPREGAFTRVSTVTALDGLGDDNANQERSRLRVRFVRFEMIEDDRRGLESIDDFGVLNRQSLATERCLRGDDRKAIVQPPEFFASSIRRWNGSGSPSRR